MSGPKTVIESAFHEERKADEHGSDNYESTRTRSIESDGFSLERQTDAGPGCQTAGAQHPTGATNPAKDGV